jgi:Recombination endonuclease VII
MPYSGTPEEQREKENASARKRRAANPEKFRAANRKHRANHLAESREKDRNYYSLNKKKENERSKQYVKDNPTKERERHYKYKYDITIAEYEKLYTAQEGCCAICKKFLPLLCVDHIHGTKIVRGLLCKTCNTSIGVLYSPELLQSALRYIEKTWKLLNEPNCTAEKLSVNLTPLNINTPSP